MNKRIEELKTQCIVREQRGTNAFDSYMVDRFDTEKFAELIVRECASKVDWIYAEKGITIDGVNFTVTQGDLIKQHFGFEE